MPDQPQADQRQEKGGVSGACFTLPLQGRVSSLTSPHFLPHAAKFLRDLIEHRQRALGDAEIRRLATADCRLTSAAIP
jgi:hypothetical protein